MMPRPSARAPTPLELTGVLQAGRKMPRMKAPSRGPLMTPMTVKEPWGSEAQKPQFADWESKP